MQYQGILNEQLSSYKLSTIMPTHYIRNLVNAVVA